MYVENGQWEKCIETAAGMVGFTEEFSQIQFNAHPFLVANHRSQSDFGCQTACPI